MFYWLIDLSETASIFNVFRYITFRTGGAVVTAALFVFMAGQRAAYSRGRPENASCEKRYADDGRPDDPFRHGRLDAAVGQPA